MSYLVESHGQSAGDGETLTILEAALDSGEIADGQVQRRARRVVLDRRVGLDRRSRR